MEAIVATITMDSRLIGAVAIFHTRVSVMRIPNVPIPVGKAPRPSPLIWFCGRTSRTYEH